VLGATQDAAAMSASTTIGAGDRMLVIVFRPRRAKLVFE
jgi:hypothetical protein